MQAGIAFQYVMFAIYWFGIREGEGSDFVQGIATTYTHIPPSPLSRVHMIYIKQFYYTKFGTFLLSKHCEFNDSDRFVRHHKHHKYLYDSLILTQDLWNTL